MTSMVNDGINMLQDNGIINGIIMLAKIKSSAGQDPVGTLLIECFALN
jgi:hypothetical protein